MVGIAPDETRTLIDELLAEQQRLTAVERFSLCHERLLLPDGVRTYRELIPNREPGRNEQYAFAVDLDACSGCKACVTACHNLNGLDEEETWRSVGLLHGGTTEEPAQQAITTACHHCVDPACLNGCPVLAYEKDPRTGIVRHLDDQCIGCQYCVLKCPYDVPKYSRRLGIVRKCDMCTNRLSMGEAPACAEACPNGAIRITLVEKDLVRSEAKLGKFLPGAPHPAYTQPTTRYLSKRPWPTNMTSADGVCIRPGHAHLPLVAMLVLTQLSVGAFAIQTFLRAYYPHNLMMSLSAWNSLAALALGLLALGASLFHLGRPWYAWRAVIGLRASWLSREIVAFGIFAALAALYAFGFWIEPLYGFRSQTAAVLVSLSGVMGVFCSFMIYHETQRPLWRGFPAAIRFGGSVLILGAAATLFFTTLQGVLYPAVSVPDAYRELNQWLARLMIGGSVVKLAAESLGFRHLRVPEHSPLRQTAELMVGPLAEVCTARFCFGLAGGVLLPAAFLLNQTVLGMTTLGITLSVLLFVGIGEWLERYLFFVAVVPARMPGGIGA